MAKIINEREKGLFSNPKVKEAYKQLMKALEKHPANVKTFA